MPSPTAASSPARSADPTRIEWFQLPRYRAFTLRAASLYPTPSIQGECIGCVTPSSEVAVAAASGTWCLLVPLDEQTRRECPVGWARIGGGISTVKLETLSFYDAGFAAVRDALCKANLMVPIHSYFRATAAEVEELKLMKTRHNRRFDDRGARQVVVLARSLGVSSKTMCHFSWCGRQVLEAVENALGCIVLSSADAKANALFERRYNSKANAAAASHPGAWATAGTPPAGGEMDQLIRGFEQVMLPHFLQMDTADLRPGLQAQLDSAVAEARDAIQAAPRRDAGRSWQCGDLPEAWQPCHWAHSSDDAGLRFFLADATSTSASRDMSVSARLRSGFGLPSDVRGAPCRAARRVGRIRMDLGEAYCLSGTYAEGRGDGYRSWLRLSPDAAFQSPCAEFVCVSGDSLLGTVEEETPWETRVRQPQRQQTQPSPAPWSAKDLLKDCSPLTQWGASQVAIPRVSACVYSDRGLACGMGVQLSVDTFVVVLEVDQNIRSAKVQLTKRTHGPGRDFEEGWVSLDDIRLDAKNDCPLTPSYFEEEPLEQWLQLLRGSQVVIPTYCCFRLRQREGESPKAHDLRMKTSGCDIVVVTPPRLVDSTSTLTERGKAPQTDSAATWKVATDSGEKVMHWTDLKQWAQGHGVILEQYDSYARYHLAGIRHEHGLRAESFKGMFGDVTPYYRYNNTKHMRWVEWLCDRIQSIASLDPSLASGTRRRLSACTAFADAAEVLEGTQWGVALSSASCLLSTLQTSSPRNDPLAAERPNGWFYMRSLRMDLAGGLPGRHMGVYRHDSTAFPLDLRASPSVTSTDTLSLRNGACFEVYGTYVSVCGREAYAYVRVTGGPASPVGCTRLVDAAGASGWVSLRSEKHISLNNEPRICWRRARLAKTEGAMSPESACLSLIGITRSLFK